MARRPRLLLSPALVLALILALAVTLVASDADADLAGPADCPVKYDGQSKALLFGGVIDADCTRSNGQNCTRLPKW